jgi:hypothetical protein
LAGWRRRGREQRFLRGVLSPKKVEDLFDSRCGFSVKILVLSRFGTALGAEQSKYYL